jgi:hypothetical protein
MKMREKATEAEGHKLPLDAFQLIGISIRNVIPDK